MPPEVSAIITTHGRPLHVVEAIASIRRETHEDLELIDVIDGDAQEIPFDSDVRVVSGQSLGVGRARNLGLAAARGEFVIFLDDDDVAFPSRIPTLVGAAERSGSGLCFGMTRRVVVEDGLVLPDVPTGLSPGPVEFCDILACAPHINAVLVRTSVLREEGGFDSDVQHFNDWSAWLRIADRGVKMSCVGETVAEWRLHSSGLSGVVAGRGQMKAHILALFDRLIPRLSSINADAMRTARQVVEERPILTYDDYAEAVGRCEELSRPASTPPA